MSEPRRSIVAPEHASWLDVIEGAAPILLIAPHGGRMGSATRAVLNPKVNDLYTAEITADLATQLRATALVNHGMDRNHLDLNRLSQLLAHAPWFLELIENHLEAIVERHGHATVLIIHGWNVIQPRLDLGLGLRRHGDELRPAGSAHVSARDAFIHGELAELTRRLSSHGIAASFGLRYPAGGAQNLLQAFTDRYADSDAGALKRLSSMAAKGSVDAAQFELSVALRMPGELRRNCVASIGDVFGARASRPAAPDVHVIRHASRPVSPRRPATPAPVPMPTRIGVELFDPMSKAGAMASFDLGPGAIGARVMILLPNRGVALFTGEGKVSREPGRISLGPLSIGLSRGALELGFNGPGVIVPDAANYLSIERALASGWLDENMRLAIRMTSQGASLEEMLSRLGEANDGAAKSASEPLFGRVEGTINIDGFRAEFDGGFARAGVSFTGLGATRFDSRRMMWASFDKGSIGSAVELRSVCGDSGEHRSGKILASSTWSECTVHRIEVETSGPDTPPETLGAEFALADESIPRTMTGAISAFVPLARPGPEGSRIYTTLGFAEFDLGGNRGGGMFEYSRRAGAASGSPADSDETED